MASRLLLAAAVCAALSPARADDVAEFFRGKTISMVVGSSVGGGYDTLSRVVARHMPKHIPGAPQIVTRNLPGAGGILAAKHIINNAPRDGTTMALLRNLAPLEPLFGTQQADYDGTKFNWLGTLAVETGLLIVWHTSKFRSFDDVRRGELLVAADGVSSQAAFYGRLMNEILGAKMKIVEIGRAHV